MTVVLPGMRSKYRIPLTNSWDYEMILDKENLADWFQRGIGLDPWKLPTQKRRLMRSANFLSRISFNPPETVMEVVNLAKADLRSFWYAGCAGGSFSYDFFPGRAIGILCILLTVEAVAYVAVQLWVTKRDFSAARNEIEAGRWTPPLTA